MKIFLIGFMGSGKTHWGSQLSRKIDLPFFDLDEQIVQQEGTPINEIFAAKGEEYFRVLEKETLHIISESHESFVMATGGGTPCYYNNIGYMNHAGITVWINAPTQVLFERLLKEKSQRPLLRDLADDQMRTFINRKFADRRIYYEQAKVTMDEEPVLLDKLIEKIFHA